MSSNRVRTAATHHARDTEPLRVVVGPTAAGKSRLSLQLAERFGLTIVSADSRQIYRGFDVGTAKPSAADLARVPHAGIDVVAPTERYSAQAWANSAKGWIQSAIEHRAPPLIVGGTGFYVRALVTPFDPVPELDGPRRRQLQLWLASLDAPTLDRWCRRLDPARATLGRSQQLRAVETALLSGTRISAFLRVPTQSAAGTDVPVLAPVRYLVVDPGPSLAERIAHRVREMMSAGWCNEVEQLMQTVPPDAPAWNACGYATIRAGVEGKQSWNSVLERVVIETRQYAKRQRTWNRHQLKQGTVTLLNPDEPDAFTRMCAWWNDERAEDA